MILVRRGLLDPRFVTKVKSKEFQVKSECLMSKRNTFLALLAMLPLAIVSSVFAAESATYPIPLPSLSPIEPYQRPMVVSEVSNVRPSDAVASTARTEVFPVDITRDLPALRVSVSLAP